MRCKARHGSNMGIYTVSTKRDSSLRLRFPAVAVQALLVLVALQFPVTGHCDSGSGWLKNLLASKGKNMKEVAKEIATLNESEEILGIDFSPDGKYLVAAGENGGAIHVWDWQNKKLVHTLVKARGAYTGLVAEPIRYSPDGHLLAACHSLALGDVVVRIWDTGTWEIVHDITNPQKGGGCSAIGFTPDGKSLIQVLDRLPEFPGDTLIIYSTDTWQPVWGLRTVPFQLGALAISPDGKFIALGGRLYDFSPTAAGLSVVEATKEMFKRKIQRQIAIVDMAQRAIIRTIPVTKMNELSVGRLAWSPDGANITIAGAGAVEVFDVHTGKQVAGELLESAEMFVRYTPDGKYLLESDNDGLGNGLGVKIWDGLRRKLLQKIPGDLSSLVVSRDGHYFAYSGVGKISVWQLK